MHIPTRTSTPNETQGGGSTACCPSMPCLSQMLRGLAALLSTGQLVNTSTNQGLTGCVQAISTSPPTDELGMGLVEVMRART